MSRSVWKGRTVACTRVCIPNELAVPGRARFGTGIVVPETGNRAYRKGACLVRDLQRSNSKDRSRYCVALYRLLGSFVLIIIVRTSRFHLLSSFPPIFSFFLPPLFPTWRKQNERRRTRGFLPWQARTHARTSPVRAARATRVCGPHMYASSSTFNRVGEFKCDQRGRGLASATSFIASRLVQLPFARTPFLLRELFSSRKSSQFGRAWYGGHAAVECLEIFILLVKQTALLSSSVYSYFIGNCVWFCVWFDSSCISLSDLDCIGLCKMKRNSVFRMTSVTSIYYWSVIGTDFALYRIVL